MTADWRISSYSGTNGSCVQVADVDDGILVRNSNHPDAGTLHLSKEQFAQWVQACAAGEFDYTVE